MGAKINSTKAGKANKLRRCHTVPQRHLLEIVKLLISRIADDIRAWMTFCRQQDCFSKAGESNFLVAILRGEQTHLKWAGESGNPGEALDNADVWSCHQDRLIDVLWLGVIKHNCVGPEVFGLEDAPNSISDTNDDCGFFDLLLERCELMHLWIPSGNLRDLVQLQ